MCIKKTYKAMEEKIIWALQTFFDCKVVLRTDGTLTTSGRAALRRLSRLLTDLDAMPSDLEDTIVDMFYRV